MSGQPPPLEQVLPRDRVSYRGQWLPFTSLACGLTQGIFLVLFAWPTALVGIVLWCSGAIVLGVVALLQVGCTGQGAACTTLPGESVRFDR
jgi:hypothetical protein